MRRLGSRRRLRPDVAAALDNIAIRRKPHREHSLNTGTKLQMKQQMNSMSRRRPPQEPPLTLTPSTLWSSLPVSLRIIVLLAGFLLLYYFLFARHQIRDKTTKKINEIHKELEDILRKANESGFMGQNLVEAVLPDIFRDLNESTAKPNGTSIELSVEHDESNDEDSAEARESESDSAHEERPKLKKKSRKKRRRKKRKEKARYSSKAKQVEAKTNVKSTNTTSGVDTLQSNIGNGSRNDGNLTSSETSAQSDTDHKTAMETKIEISNTSSSSPSPSKATETVEESPNANSTSPTSEETSGPNRKSDVQTAKTASTSSGEAESGSSKDSLPPEFADLVNQEVSTSSIPILNWNVDAIMSESVPEQIFNLGERHDHVFMYKPLCLDTRSGEGIIFEGTSACSGFNRTVEWTKQYCSDMKTAVQKEYLLTVKPERKRKKWLTENTESIHWVTELTSLQVLERNCGNIAHFAGRALLLQHIIENVGSYAAPPSEIANILVMPSFHTMKRFLYPQNYDHWHRSLMKSLVAPASLEIGDLGNFLYRASRNQNPKEPLVQLLHNFSTAGSQFAEKKYVCFKRALIPGYLKGRFFVDDIEYPSTKPSLQHDAEDTPSVPRDSLRLRERVSSLINQTPVFSKRRKEIVFIDRRGSRRIFEETKKPVIMKAFEDVATKHGYSFEVISFEKKSFDEQYKAVDSASIAIGIHGANLVNAIFMPPLAVLIELFPYGFVHEMYRDGGNAGLKYFSYQMSTGKHFKGPRVYRSPEQCVRSNKDCKVHYRDATMQATDSDIASMTQILEKAIEWCGKLPASSETSKGKLKNRR